MTRAWFGWVLLVAAVAPATPAAATPTAVAPTFESHWQDGRAELDGYRYTVSRYGEPRRGTAVMVFVTEPFSEAKRVKVDDPRKNPPGDTFEALKLNFVRDFQTGIYDYNTMASLFVRSRDFSPAKLSFSSAEWCGHVYEEMIFERHHLADRYASYFENESEIRRLPLQPNGITEEELLIRMRSLRGDWLRPGEGRALPLLPAAFLRRLTHRTLQWTEAAITRSKDAASVSVPAGRFTATVYTVRVKDGREGRFWIEAAYPHRVIRWEWKAAETSGRGGWSPSEGLDSGELTGSARLRYWELHNPGDESYLTQLGLTAGPGGASALRTAPSRSSHPEPRSSSHRSK